MKVNSTLVILMTTLFFLFAGHFIYQSQFIEKPLRAALNSLPNVSLRHVTLQPKNVRIIVGTTPNFSLKEYPDLIDKIQDIVGNRKIQIQVVDQPDAALESAWQKMVFGVQEGMTNSKFTQVNDTVNKIAKANQVSSVVIMDDRYLFIELRHQNKYLLKVYPLDKISNDVKNND